MPIFIKTEKFKKETLELSNSERKNFLLMHKEWVKKISQFGHYIHSGYLINEKKMPGGGGLLIFGIIYLISIPIGIIIYSKQNKKISDKISEENHEDIL